MKILIVCSDFPYPADHGGRVDTWGRIKALAELGWKLHLVVCGKQRPSPEELDAAGAYIERVTLCDRRSGLGSFLSTLPMQASSRGALTHVELEGGYDYVLLEGDYVYPVLANPAVQGSTVILRVHNDEALYFKALARSTSRPVHKLYYFMESKKFTGLRKRLIAKVDSYLFISSKELERFRSEHPQSSSVFLPPPITRDSFESSTFASKNVVFIGSMFMPNNREAIEWYLEHVHPLLRNEPGYQFIVAGNSRGQSLDWLNAYDLTGVVVHDTPASLDAIYESGYLFVNPMQNGAGVKLKTIEAIQNGLPVISTSIGCEGTGLEGGKHILIADNPQQFYRDIKRLLDNSQEAGRLLDASQQFIRTHYNHKEVLKGLIETINPGYHRTKQVLGYGER